MAPGDVLEVEVVAHGRAAFDALAEAVEQAQAGDPLAPVTVVTPSPAVAVTLRRRLGRHLGGLVGVDFADLGGVAEALAAPHLAAHGLASGVDGELVVASVRVALQQRGGRLGRIGHHRTTWEVVASALTELASLDAEARAALPTDGLVGELVALHDEVARSVPLGSGAAVLALATDLVRRGVVDASSLGPVVVHLPDRPSAAAAAFVRALAERTPVRLLVGSAGRADDDAEIVRAFGVADVPAVVPPPTVKPTIVSSNDLDDEVRGVVRRLLARAEAGVAWEDMALVHPPGAPCARIVADVVRAAGIPASMPSVDTLAQTAPGRVVLAVVAVAEAGFSRESVVDLWASAVVVDEVGAPVPFAAFDRASRLLGIRRAGAAAWHGAIERELRRLEDRDPDDEHRRRRADVARAMQRALTTLDELVAALPTEWPGVGPWVASVLDTLCGPVAHRAGWPDHEIAADAAIRTAAARLGALAAVETEPDPSLVRTTLRTTLDAPAPRRERLGHGLFVTSLDHPPVVPLDTVALVGLVEGQAPRVLRDDVLVGDAVRTGVGLPTTEQRSRAQRRSFDAAVASADQVRILSFARNDQRSGRTQVPSRWVVEALRGITDERVATEDLMAGRSVPGVDVEVVPSFDASLRAVAAPDVAAQVPLDRHERLLAELHTGDLARHPARGLTEIAAAAELLSARAAHRFTRFDGNLGGSGVDVTAAGALSPTSLETYATCPRKWFFGHALGLAEPERPEQIDRIEPRTRGSLVHTVLERFFGEAIDAGTVPAPGTPWRDEDRARLIEVAQEECDRLEARGLTGHPRRWAHDRLGIQRSLQQALSDDVTLRAERGIVPAYVEFTFGEERAPVVVGLDDGREILLRGHIDRVDLDTVDGVPARGAVWDYKHASVDRYKDIAADGGDPLQGGVGLQLAAYALAVRDVLGAREVEARYWFVKPGDEGVTVGYPLTDELAERFRRVVGVLAVNIEQGRFPARPGEYEWHRSDFAACTWCDFTRICPQDRDEEWERVRFDPSLRAYDRLVTDGSATVMEDGT